ncbi:MAG: BACON domain-containing protein [Alistipes sp.]|nr:BACON domain-containing protein [Alistipes sp.]
MKKFLYSLLALPMLLVACGQEINTPVDPAAPKFELTSQSTMEFDAEGGKGTISFTYNFEGSTGSNDHPTFNVKVLDVTCDAEWIELPSEVKAYDNSFNFAVAKNESEEARQATITASIEGLSFDVTVMQAGAVVGGNEDDEPKDEFVEGWAINGTMNDWVKKDAVAMTEEGDFFAVKGFELAADDNFNFIFNGTEKSYGGNGQTSEPNTIYEAKSWGSNISVTEAGKYDVYLSADLKNYYIMNEGVSPAEAEAPLKPGEKRWSIFGTFEGNNRVADVELKVDGKYYSVKGIKFVEDMSFVVRCNGGEAGTLGVASSEAYAVEGAIKLEVKSDANYEIKVAAEEGQKYDIYFTYNDDNYEVWVMPGGQYPIIWDRVDGAYFASYNNFILYLITNDIVLSLDFTAGNETVVNNVIPAGTYYVGDTEGNGWCFDVDYCQAKIRGREVPVFDGSMKIEHKDGKYDIFVDMRTATLDVLKMHYVGEIGFDPFFANMGGLKLNSPEK